MNENLVIRTLVELADNLVEDFDVVDLLSRLVDRCVEVVDVAAAGVMLAPPSGALQVVASSSEAMRVLELYELQADQGPCLDCFASARPWSTSTWPRPMHSGRVSPPKRSPPASTPSMPFPSASGVSPSARSISSAPRRGPWTLPK